MSEPFLSSLRPASRARIPRRTRIHRAPRRTTGRLAAAALALALATAGCSSSGTDTRAGATGTGQTTVTGPLCDLLPSGTQPGNPASLVAKPADEALQWITVLTRFESAIRAAGLTAELHGAKGVTILAPTDDAFEDKFSEETIDELFYSRKDDLRRLLKSHLVDGSLSLSELVGAGTVTTLAGTSIKVTGADTMARIADGAETVCANYQVANARIHIIDKVLGDLPTTATDKEHRSH